MAVKIADYTRSVHAEMLTFCTILVAGIMMDQHKTSGLSRQLTFTGLVATGICSMLGASIYVVPFMIQRNIPGIGPYVLQAFMMAAVPAILAAFAYAILASAMPRAGGSYVYASRGISPYLGFIASFSQWFGLSIAIGVVSYVIIPFLRDIALAMEWNQMAAMVSQGSVRVCLSLMILWFFVWINIRGAAWYERTLIPLMVMMFALGSVVIVTGLTTDPGAFAIDLMQNKQREIPQTVAHFDPWIFLSAASVLFSSFIGFDSIAQAGGEAKNPGRNLPLAIAMAVVVVGTFYMIFTFAVYRVVPWQFVASEAAHTDVTAPGLMSRILSPGWTVCIIAGAAVALTNDLPAMLLSVSRLMFAWAGDGIFPKSVTRIHPTFNTPQVAILISGTMASIGILGSHFAGDFFLGIDILVTSMLVNFLVMCLAVATLPTHNPALASQVKVVRNRNVQWLISVAGVLVLSAFLIIHIVKDFSADVPAWYYHSTAVWLIVMLIGSLIYFREVRRLRAKGEDLKSLFSNLPPE